MKAIINIENEILTIDGYKGQVDLSEYQGSDPNLIRVYDDGEKNLVVDPPTAFRLLAEVPVPAAKHVDVPILDEEENPVLDDEGQERTTSERTAILADDVSVIAWEL